MYDMAYRGYDCICLCRVTTAAGAYWDNCWMCRLYMRCRGFGGLLSQKAQAVIVRVYGIVNPFRIHLQLTLFRFLVPGGGPALFELLINRAVRHDDLQTINGNHPVFRIPAAIPLIVKS